jgi:hypothetical protein
VGEDVVLPLDRTIDFFWLGSGLDVHLHLPRQYVSRRHVSLRRMRGQLDLSNQSPNGTRIEGRASPMRSSARPTGSRSAP